jgi:DGQHR domain-containing protein
MKIERLSAILITQGKHKFYSLTMPIDILSECCSPNPRSKDLDKGFQRTLDENRAIAIASYIREGGVIPSSIILSAQDSADFEYNSKSKTISFEVSLKSFLILDGQHRVYGFKHLLKDEASYRIPVIIFNELSPVEEARIFIDINTLQQPVPKELLFDIKRLAERETDEEKILDALFTEFESNKTSYLLGKLSRIEKARGHISKVTFYEAMKQILKEFDIDNTTRLFRIVNAFLLASNDIAKDNNIDFSELIVKATVFRIFLAHAKAVIALIADNHPENMELISEHKKYLSRSLPTSFQHINEARAYLKVVEMLDRKLIKKSIRI